MSLTKLEADLAIHQKLDDEPNDVGGLTAQELKEKFDEAGLTIQRYLNETHLPQVEEAVREAVETAKGYADRKVVAIGAGDMAAAVYDTRKRGVDVYTYAEEAAQAALGDAARFGFVAAGTAQGAARLNGETTVMMTDGVDPRGLWDREGQRFVVPAGARAMVITLQVKWGRMVFSSCTVKAKVNGVVKCQRSGPDDSSGAYVRETLVLPLEVQGGDRVQVTVSASSSGSDNAVAEARSIRAEIIV